MPSHYQNPGDIDNIEYISEPPQKNKLQSLYARYLEQLNNPSLVLRDDILKILVEMEETIESILLKNPIELSPRRFHLYGLRGKPENHFHRTLAQESELMKKELRLPGLSTQHLLSQVGRQVERLLNKNIFLSGNDIEAPSDVGE